MGIFYLGKTAQSFRPSALSLALLLVSIVPQGSVVAAQGFTTPGDAAWISDGAMGDGTPDYKPYLPIIYVVMSDGAIPSIRAIIDSESSCPTLADTSATSSKFPTVQTRGVGTNELPRAFPVRVCEVKITSPPNLISLENGDLEFVDENDVSHPIPKVTRNPKRFLLTGDSGLRVKPSNLGLGKCSDGPLLYDVHQCAENFTQSDLTEMAEGDFQDLEEDWPLQEMMNHVAANDSIDAIVFVGDYIYRQGPCPVPNSQGIDCSAINLPEMYTVNDIEPGTVINFLPGTWGDNWWGWWAEYFYPALEILKVAPIMGLRGNHETCPRAGHGYFLFMAQMEYPSGVRGGDFCIDYAAPYTVAYEHEQFLIPDDSNIDPMDEGVDHFDFVKGACPGPTENGDVIVPNVQNRYLDDSQTNTSIAEQLGIFTESFAVLEEKARSFDTNFLVTHHPLLAVACNNTEMTTMDWTLQQTIGSSLLSSLSGVVSGHMHWSEALEFEEDALPTQIVVGNGGTKLIENYVDQDVFPSLQLEIGAQDDPSVGRVKSGFTRSQHGYAIMERREDVYLTRFHAWNATTKKMSATGDQVRIPRRGDDSGGSSSSDSNRKLDRSVRGSA